MRGYEKNRCYNKTINDGLKTITMDQTDLAYQLCLIAQRAGGDIMDVKAKLNNGDIRIKGDGSPVTIADMRAHDTICRGLSRLMPGTPIVSEEGLSGNPNTSEVSFVVDPLDGTKEFIKGNGMYTVNIALARRIGPSRWKPVLGVVVAPETGTTWFGGTQVEAARQRSDSIQKIRVNNGSNPPVVVGSVSHPSPKDRLFRDDLGDHTFEGVGSSMKICMVADGTADLTARFGPTSCWDTAAAHAVLNSAGGNLLNPSGEELDYDLVDNRLNPPFLATRGSNWVDVWIRHQE
jgi:3'(2'), 5'-bisphosphate nucleotidase